MRGVLFDKDGTLIDFDASFGAAYRELALEVTGGDSEAAERLLAIGGMDPLSGHFRPGSVLAAGTTPEIIRAWFADLEGAAFDDAVRWLDSVFYTNGVRGSVPIVGLNRVLEELEGAGFVLGVATNDGTEATRAALQALGVGDRLPHVFGYDSVVSPKPAPDSVHAFVEVAGVAACDVAVVGDNLRDLVMARNAGAGLAIGVLTGHGDPAELGAAADVMLPGIRELPAWLERHWA